MPLEIMNRNLMSRIFEKIRKFELEKAKERNLV
jgi:hypothetical protein